MPAGNKSAAFWRSCVTVSLPMTRAERTWGARRSRPLRASSGKDSATLKANPKGANKTMSATSPISGSEPCESGIGSGYSCSPRSDAVTAQLALAVRELALVLDQETGLADKLPWLLGQNPGGGLAPFIALNVVLLLVLFLLLFLVAGHDQAGLQDHVETGFYVVAVLFVFVVVVLLLLGREEHLALLVGFFHLRFVALGDCQVGVVQVLVDELVFAEV